MIRELRQKSMVAHFYEAYGLGIRSTMPLPELSSQSSSSTGFDVDLIEAPLPVDDTPEKAFATWHLDSSRLAAQWRGVGTLVAEGGRVLHCQQAAEGPDLLYRLFVLSQGLGIILQQRGKLVLHASAVELQGHAIAFVGECGQGKSTMAAAACAHGANLLADDMATVTFAGDRILVEPAFPKMRLNRDSLLGVGLRTSHEARAISGTNKFLYDLPTPFSPRSRDLKRVYVLTDGPDFQISTLSGREALLPLYRHTYGRTLVAPLKSEATHLQQCSALVSNRIVRKIVRPRSLEALPFLLERIAEDLRSAE